MNPGHQKGVVFNIQHYSIHDGPGIRTTVFLKGCPLNCLWCQNPESQKMRPVLFFDSEKCTGCAKCLEVCPEGAIRMKEERSMTDRTLCRGRGQCVSACPNEVRTLMGQYFTAAEVFEDVNKDAIFYQDSQGGVTLSGGDPVAQPDFSIEILKTCREAGIHTAVETCGYADWETLKAILDHTDLVLYDFKHMDPEKHRAFTGVPNELIIDNARKIRHTLDLPMSARIPVIPGHNDSIENLENTADFIVKELGHTLEVHLLPFHRLGEIKYERMELPKKPPVIQSPGQEIMEEFKALFESRGLTVRIGG